MTAVKRSIAGLLTAATLASTGYYAGQQTAPAPATHAASRSGHWPKVRADHLALHPVCAVCGGKDAIEVHHVRPYHTNPALELDPTNLITLCRDHHGLFGHLGRWSSWNIDVREDAVIWRKKIESRPE